MPVVLTDDLRNVDRFRITLGDDVVAASSIQELQTYVDAHPAEDVVIIGPHAPMTTAVDFAVRYRLVRPSLGVVLLRSRLDLGTLSEAMRAGIREVVPTDDVEAQVAAIKRSVALSRQIRGVGEESESEPRGTVIMTFGAKGGYGKTIVSVNLAAAIHAMHLGRVCLVDFDLAFGDVAIALHVEPDVTIGQAAQMQGDLDQRAVASLLTRYQPDFDVLLAPVSPVEAEFITSDLAADIIDNLRQMYSFVIIDAPAAFHEITLRCLDLADQYVLMTSLDVPALKSLKVALDTLDTLGYPRSKWRIVLNRANAQVGLTMDDVEGILGIPVTVAIPSSGDVPASLNAGETMIESRPNHPVTLALKQLASLVTYTGVAPSVEPERGGLFRFLGRRP